MQYCWCPIWTNRSVVNVWLGITADQQSPQPAVMWRSWFQEVRQPASHCRPFVVWVPVYVPHLVPANSSQWGPVNVHNGDQLTCQAGACCVWVCWSAVSIIATLVFFLFSRKTLLIIYIRSCRIFSPDAIIISPGSVYNLLLCSLLSRFIQCCASLAHKKIPRTEVYLHSMETHKDSHIYVNHCGDHWSLKYVYNEKRGGGGKGMFLKTDLTTELMLDCIVWWCLSPNPEAS
jgi:hypothetical protein